jgi:hypothetical protein
MIGWDTGIFDPKYFKAAMASAKASRWTIFRARLFGKREFEAEDRGHVECRRWRGTLYLIDYEEYEGVDDGR